MKLLPPLKHLLCLLLAGFSMGLEAHGELTAGQVAKLPPPAGHTVDFAREIQPLFEASCVKCHAKGKAKGDLSLETRASFLKGGETGPAAVPGSSAGSLIVEMVAALDPESTMPKKGSKWTAEQVGLLRAWIDQGAPWPEQIRFAKPAPQNLHPHPVTLPAGKGHPVDALLGRYYSAHGAAPGPVVGDPAFARRAYLDLIGLLPSEPELERFLGDRGADKRARLVRSLLGRREDYADHWLSFWNDLLRNDYEGTGYVDGGRKQVTGWLYTALATNLPYDQFVTQLVNPKPASEGFTQGIIWRGNVNASMLPPMQAAQNLSQVFLGVNLKCASCHDSFINDWSLADAYGLAAVYADGPLELVHCDKPTGKTAAMQFLYPELGALPSDAAKVDRLRRLAEIVTGPKNGRLPRTIVNRVWARLLGRGLVEPLDDMEKSAWSPELVDWLAEDFVSHGYDLKHLLERICTSRAYQTACAAAPEENGDFVFRGPLARRLSAEQFADAVSTLGGDWERLPSTLEFDFAASGLVGDLQMPKWIWTDEALAPPPVPTPAKTEAAPDAFKPVAAPATAKPKKAAGAKAGRRQASAAPAGGVGRHKVLFRKTFTLTKVPESAYAALLASQRFDLQVNGKDAKSVLRDGARNGRVALFDLRPLLVAGTNVITIDVSSHTEKQMNDTERQKYPASTEHLNRQSGMAFYLRCMLPGKSVPIELRSDQSWRVKRRPEGEWAKAGFDDTAWPVAQVLPAGVAPIDEGPGLEPVLRKDFANRPVQLGPQLRPAVSTSARTGKIRAGLREADPLQVALERPNREVVVSTRSGAPTTLQGLELTNGSTLDERLKKAAARMAPVVAKDTDAWLRGVYSVALCRKPTPAEVAMTREFLGSKPEPSAIADVLWALLSLPEFQLIQ